MWGIIWAGGSGTQWERVGDKQAAPATLDCPGGLCQPACWKDGDDNGCANSVFCSIYLRRVHELSGEHLSNSMVELNGAMYGNAWFKK